MENREEQNLCDKDGNRNLKPYNLSPGGRTVEAPEVTPMVRGPSRSQGAVSTSSPCASLCVMALRATSMQAAEFTQNDGTPFTSGISCAPPRQRAPVSQLHGGCPTASNTHSGLHAGSVLKTFARYVLHAGSIPK